MALTPAPLSCTRVREAVFAAHERLRALLPGLTTPLVREPSALPGWRRAHVLSHLEGVCLALAGQARAALEDRLAEVYDGGRPARDAAIEAGARRDAGALREAVAAALTAAERQWRRVGPGDWTRRVRYRDADLRAALLAWWREVEIHTADLLLGPTPADWTREFCGHALDFLAPRAPLGLRLELVATDGGERRTFGEEPGTPGEEPSGESGRRGELLTVRGTLADLTAWLAGRAPTGTLTPARLPALRPWP
ncbi:maleylpyruvate isomerase family mycothiol-dependent enzyme [Streptomyces hoynatensis]|uniref:Maleylpyruvate isomerase family mycothiol-dependent enzyme n=1 Tax=Streptomyces hoynatensis TaxID=1141874 RepID=A0A3A9ZCB5_9ACTN|nr:maleylpyruvate isomerase family mycothiol-dependent enzyme [Streptomyces hoynatensis]RKN44977.1 maleylpyruvate isomerase family mycothiol-dependent enzyme [Streptomyces hoynatensis]